MNWEDRLTPVEIELEKRKWIKISVFFAVVFVVGVSFVKFCL
jgi:hypothetical protein